MENGNEKIRKMLETNIRQKEYYEYDIEQDFRHGGNVFTRLWNNLRQYQYKMTDDLSVNEELFEIHKKWIGSLEGKKVLDLGCHSGNELSLYLAKNSREYHGLDLSSSALSVLEDKFEKANIYTARLHAVDILSDEFAENGFDLIYAKAIFHHFRHFDEFLGHISSRLAPGGHIITVDPMNTYLPLKIVRALYRSFQHDKDWEYPFTKDSIRLIEKHFKIEKLAGMMGKTKYAFPLYMISRNYAMMKSRKWMDEDFYKVSLKKASMWNCLRVSFLLGKK